MFTHFNMCVCVESSAPQAAESRAGLRIGVDVRVCLNAGCGRLLAQGCWLGLQLQGTRVLVRRILELSEAHLVSFKHPATLMK